MVQFNGITSSSGTNASKSSSGVKANTENKTNFLQQFKDYFHGIKNKDSKYHNITVSEVKSMEAQLHRDLIRSGATVVSYDEKTGMTKYSNGVEIHFNASDSNANLFVELDEEGQYASANMGTKETENSDYNSLEIFEDNNGDINEEQGIRLVYESDTQVFNNIIEQSYSMDDYNNGLFEIERGFHSEKKDET